MGKKSPCPPCGSWILRHIGHMASHMTTTRPMEVDEGSESESEVDIHSDDSHSELRRAGLVHRKKTRREVFQEMPDMLEGSDMSKKLAYASFFVACFNTVLGIFNPFESIRLSYR